MAVPLRHSRAIHAPLFELELLGRPAALPLALLRGLLRLPLGLGRRQAQRLLRCVCCLRKGLSLLPLLRVEGLRVVAPGEG